MRSHSHFALFVILLFCLGLTSCAGRQTSHAFHTRLYKGQYDDVWRATLKALNDYPLKITNKDTGRIQSEIVNGPYNELLFNHPDNIQLPERFRYSVDFNFAKLVSDDEKPVTRVRVIKNLERFEDFYRGWREYSSDGLEEQVLLYRIEHILGMDTQIEKQAGAQ